MALRPQRQVLSGCIRRRRNLRERTAPAVSPRPRGFQGHTSRSRSPRAEPHAARRERRSIVERRSQPRRPGELHVTSLADQHWYRHDHPSQCGHPACPEISSFKMVNGPKLGGAKEKVVKAAAGITFSVVLTESGKGEHISVAPMWFSVQPPRPSVCVWERGEGSACQWTGGRAHRFGGQVCLRL